MKDSFKENDDGKNKQNKIIFKKIGLVRIIIVLLSLFWILCGLVIITSVFKVLGLLDGGTNNNASLIYGDNGSSFLQSGSALFDGSYTEAEFVELVNSFVPPDGVSSETGLNFKWGYNTYFKANASNFYKIATSYGMDPRFVFSIGIHESGYGTSNISQAKLNFFGYGAYDSDPYGGAHGYSSMAASIEAVSKGLKNYVTEGTVYYNMIKGKGYDPTTIEGCGSIYASDPDWAKKVRQTMIRIFGQTVSATPVGDGTVISESGDGYTQVYTSSYGRTYKEFKQNGPSSYRDKPYGDDTIAAQGCSITSIAIVLSGYGYNYTPATWSSSSLVSIYGETNKVVPSVNHTNSVSGATSENKEAIQNHLKTGNPVIIHVLSKSPFTANQHWMALLDISSDGSQVYLSNPNITGVNGWVNIDTALTDLMTYILVGGGN